METSNFPRNFSNIDLERSSNERTFFDIVRCNPKIVCRLLSILFSVIVFGCMSGVERSKNCVFNGSSNACHYGFAISLLGLVGCLILLGADLQFNNIWSDVFRRYLLGCDFFFSTLWTLLWFVGFCYLANEWRESSIKTQWETDHARVIIAFSFFSVFSWTASAVMAWARYSHMGGMQATYETLPQTRDDYNSTDTNKYSIFPEMNGSGGSGGIVCEGPQYVVPPPPRQGWK